MLVSGLVIGEKVLVGSNFGIVISDGNKVAFVIESVEGVFLVADVVDEEDTVEVVDFVEESASEEAFGLEADFVTIFEEGLHFNLMGAGDAAVDFGNRETAFVINFFFTFGTDDLGVDEGGEMLVFFVVEVVADDDNALVDAELRGGHSSREFVGVVFLPVEGAFNHIRNNRAGFVGDFTNFDGFGAETGVGSGNNWFH